MMTQIFLNFEMKPYRRYRGTIEWSEEDGCWCGKVSGINDYICYEGCCLTELEQNFHAAVDDYYEFCEEVGKRPEMEDYL